MYTKFKTKAKRTSIKRNTSYTGETIEEKIRRIFNNKEPITDGAPLLYTDRKDGVRPEYNIRNDKWEQAIEGTITAQGLDLAKREFKNGERTYDTMTKEQQEAHTKKFPDSKFNRKNGGAESIQATPK